MKTWKESALLRAFLVLIIIFAGLYTFIFKDAGKKEVSRAFYFWEGRSSLDSAEDSILTDQQVKKLYVKFFEVEFNEIRGPIPISKSVLNLHANKYDSLEVIPTIYIQNEVFKGIQENELNDFSEKVWHLITKKYQENIGKIKKLKEIQIDCDWTISTKDKYISFLKILKSKINCRLSATLRLYAYKFPDQMGVLPVDRAMLLCYNLLPPVGSNNQNSILELSELKKYLIGANEYPIPLDIGLPLFSNAVVYKNNHFSGLLHSDLEEVKSVLKPYKKYWSVVTKDTTFEETFLMKGDKVKLETVSPQKINRAIDIITENVSLSNNYTVAFYYLNYKQLESYESKEIRTFYNAFKP